MAYPLFILRSIEVAGDPAELSHVPALAAEGERVHHLGSCQQANRPPSEGFRRRQGPNRGQLQHQVSAPQQGQTGPGPLVQGGGTAALDPVTAHDSRHGAVFAQNPAAFRDLVGVAGVERIVFGDDTDDVHEIDLLVDYLPHFAKKRLSFFRWSVKISPSSSLPHCSTFRWTRQAGATKI